MGGFSNSGALTEVSIPGPGFRSIPEIRFDLPSDWYVTEFPECLLAFVGAGENDWTNVLVRHERIRADMSLAEVATEYQENVSENFPGAQVVEHLWLEYEPLQYVCHLQMPYEFPPPAWVTRIDALFFGPNDGTDERVCADLFQVSWISALLNDAGNRQDCFDFLKSVRFPPSEARS